MDLSIALADFLQSLACNGVGKGATMMGVGWDTQDNKQIEALRKSIGSKDIPGWKIYRIYPTVAISEIHVPKHHCWYQREHFVSCKLRQLLECFVWQSFGTFRCIDCKHKLTVFDGKVRAIYLWCVFISLVKLWRPHTTSPQKVAEEGKSHYFREMSGWWNIIIGKKWNTLDWQQF